MIKCRTRLATKSFKKCPRSFFDFLLVEAEEIGVEAEAIDELAGFTSLVGTAFFRITESIFLV